MTTAHCCSLDNTNIGTKLTGFSPLSSDRAVSWNWMVRVGSVFDHVVRLLSYEGGETPMVAVTVVVPQDGEC